MSFGFNPLTGKLDLIGGGSGSGSSPVVTGTLASPILIAEGDQIVPSGVRFEIIVIAGNGGARNALSFAVGDGFLPGDRIIVVGAHNTNKVTMPAAAPNLVGQNGDQVFALGTVAEYFYEVSGVWVFRGTNFV